MNDDFASERRYLEIEDYRVEFSKNLVFHQGKAIQVTPKMLAVLKVLAENQGQTVTKEFLLESVWDGTVTTDMVLSRAISDLRKLFNDSARKQSFISTISKQGYCLVKPVTWKFAKRAVETSRLDKLEYKVILMLLFVAASIYPIFFANQASHPDEFYSVPKLTNLTADKSMQRFTRFSRDGTQIAYLQREEDREIKVLVRQLEDDSITTVKSYQASKNILTVNFAFSPEGNKLAIKEMLIDSCTISIVDLETLEEHVLKHCPKSTIASVDWSPDSRELVVTNFEQSTLKVGLSKINIDSDAMQEFSMPSQQASGFLFPRYSASGESILIVTAEPRLDRWGVAIVDSVSGSVEHLLQTENKINQAVWNESEKSIFYVVDSGHQPGIWYYDLVSKTKKCIHTIDRTIRDLDFSFQTKQFSYIQEAYDLDIWKKSIDEDGQPYEEKLTLSSIQNSNPRLSPNGQFLALFSKGKGEHELIVKRLENEETVLQYSRKGMKFVDVSWSPNNQQLLLTMANHHESKLFKVDINNGNAIDIKTEQGINPLRGRWSADGQTVYWSEQGESGWRVAELYTQKTMDEQQRVEAQTNYYPVDLSQEHFFASDGYVYYKKGGHFLMENRIYRCQLKQNDCNSHMTGAAEEVVLSSRYLALWELKNNVIYYATFQPDTFDYRFYKMPLSTMESVYLYSLPRELLPVAGQLSISADQKTVYFTKKQRTNFDIIMMKQRITS